jgi:hypothetical protein
VRIGYVKVVFQPVVAVIPVVKDGNAFRALVDPAAKADVPLFDFQHGSGVGALRIDQDLLVKPALVVPAGRTQKRRPSGGSLCNPLCRELIQAGNHLVFCCHWERPPFVVSYRS